MEWVFFPPVWDRKCVTIGLELSCCKIVLGRYKMVALETWHWLFCFCCFVARKQVLLRKCVRDKKKKKEKHNLVAKRGKMFFTVFKGRFKTKETKRVKKDWGIFGKVSNLRDLAALLLTYCTVTSSNASLAELFVCNKSRNRTSS